MSGLPESASLDLRLKAWVRNRWQAAKTIIDEPSESEGRRARAQVEADLIDDLLTTIYPEDPSP
jgi:hypothetical protein